MNAEKEKAKAKIVKLLALANRPGTPEEGVNALTRAQNLAKKHGFKVQQKQPVRLRPTRITVTFDDLFGDATATRVNRNYATQEAARAERRQRSEERRKATAYAKAFDRGYLAASMGVGSCDCPYDKHVWGVNLPSAWRDGHARFWEGA